MDSTRGLMSIFETEVDKTFGDGLKAWAFP
jgi:hypothetical protein